jgi:hypothetical protein
VARSQVDISRIADDKHHAPRIGGDKAGEQIRGWVRSCSFGEIAYKRRKRQNDDVVARKHRQKDTRA